MLLNTTTCRDGFDDGALPAVERFHFRGIDVHTYHVKTLVGKAGSGYRAHVSKTKNADRGFHWRAPSRATGLKK